MKFKTFFKRTPKDITLAGLVLVVAIIIYSAQYFGPGLVANLPVENASEKNSAETTNPLEQAQLRTGLPARLFIPKIGVDTAIEYVGTKADGTMDVPKKQENVAWYAPGTRPGEVGSAVIAGHYGKWDNGRGSVFDNLNKLRPGDKISVRDDSGGVTAFIVREIRSYDPKADATGVFVSESGKSQLNLITCEGSWNNVSRSYSKRLVVFTDKE